jgi:hypothetical protein
MYTAAETAAARHVVKTPQISLARHGAQVRNPSLRGTLRFTTPTAAARRGQEHGGDGRQHGAAAQLPLHVSERLQDLEIEEAVGE